MCEKREEPDQNTVSTKSTVAPRDARLAASMISSTISRNSSGRRMANSVEASTPNTPNAVTIRKKMGTIASRRKYTHAPATVAACAAEKSR